MNKQPLKPIDDIEHVTQLTAAGLVGQLQDRRNALGLRQEDLAARAGVSRSSVLRAEAEDGNPTLSNFVRLALALNLQVTLAGAGNNQVAPEDIVHRGLAHNRTKARVDGKDREREAALAAAWEEVNEYRRFGVQSLMPALVPGHTQEQATAAATVIQWLGTQIGFDFLVKTLDSCGHQVIEKARSR